MLICSHACSWWGLGLCICIYSWGCSLMKYTHTLIVLGNVFGRMSFNVDWWLPLGRILLTISLHLVTPSSLLIHFLYIGYNLAESPIPLSHELRTSNNGTYPVPERNQPRGITLYPEKGCSWCTAYKSYSAVRISFIMPSNLLKCWDDR